MPLDRDEVLRHLREAPHGQGKRDLVRALGIKSSQRRELKAILRELKRDGLIEAAPGRRLNAPGTLPRATVVEIVSSDDDGDLIGRPTGRDFDPKMTVLLPFETLPARSPGVGDRVLVKTTKTPDGGYRGSVVKVLPRDRGRLVGVVETVHDGLQLRPADRRAKPVRLDPNLAGNAIAGDLVSVEIIDERGFGLARGRVIDRLGSADDPKQFSRMAAAELDLPETFSPEALALAETAVVPDLGSREDLRDIPLITIDGADARDFDDAVFAEPDDDANNPGGFRLLVAIADVAHYVRPGDALDRDAQSRGNSVYFPDRVIPMLPEALSNGLCSLRPDEPRACLVCSMTIDAQGQLRRHGFRRGLMRSAARLTYEQVQQAADGNPDEAAQALVEPVIAPLYAAFQALAVARRTRGTLDLDMPERVIELDDQSVPVRIGRRERLDSHRLIEEFMVLANVAAAETLEKRQRSGLYRVHDKPDPVKIEALAQLLQGMGLGWKAQSLRSQQDFGKLLRDIHEHPLKTMINGYVLRAQSQAVYSPENIGHFGLNLRHYAHFTSPIRRYADLVVHRALIEGLDLGTDGVRHEHATLSGVGTHISGTERRAMEAERRTADRFVSYFLADRVGSRMPGRVNSVLEAGLFVRLDEVDADLFVHVSTLGADFFRYDPSQQALFGDKTGAHFGQADRVEVELVTADSLTGGLTGRVVDHWPAAKRQASRSVRTAPRGRGRPPPRRGRR